MEKKSLADKIAAKYIPEEVRPDVRPAMAKEETPAQRAARRVAELRGNDDGQCEGHDDFAAPMPPEGWSYQWKRFLTAGQEDPSYQVQLARSGWEAVPATRHPEMMPISTKSKVIERKGMILMEKPLELVEEARNIELKKARQQVRAKEAQLSGTPDGTLSRDDARVQPKIKKGYEPMPIPTE